MANPEVFALRTDAQGWILDLNNRTTEDIGKALGKVQEAIGSMKQELADTRKDLTEHQAAYGQTMRTYDSSLNERMSKAEQKTTDGLAVVDNALQAQFKSLSDAFAGIRVEFNQFDQRITDIEVENIPESGEATLVEYLDGGAGSGTGRMPRTQASSAMTHQDSRHGPRSSETSVSVSSLGTMLSSWISGI